MNENRLEFYQHISKIISNHFNFKQPDIQFSNIRLESNEDGVPYLTRGQYFTDTNNIILCKEGQTIKILLHELAHAHMFGQLLKHTPIFETMIHGPLFIISHKEVKEAFDILLKE